MTRIKQYVSTAWRRPLLAVALCLCFARCGVAGVEEAARLVVSQVRVPTGIALDIGCGDARLAIAVARASGLKIWCLEDTAEKVAAARARVDAAGLYGTRICVNEGRLDRLDLPAHCANLVIFGDDAGWAYCVRAPDGELVWRFRAALGDDAIVGSPTLEFTHHAASYYDERRCLPIVTDKAIYARDGLKVAADRREAYHINRYQGTFTWAEVDANRPRGGKIMASPKAADCLWNAADHPRLTALILAGETLVAGWHGEIVALDSANGRKLWSGRVAGEVRDLAVFQGCLLATTDAGDVVCFAPAGKGHESRAQRRSGERTLKP